nr:MAG TPA: hypothetical protein [Caudoviricetes sp.]
MLHKKIITFLVDSLLVLWVFCLLFPCCKL